MFTDEVLDSPLGKKVDYPVQYTPALLCPIARDKTWLRYDYKKIPYQGVDIWNAYELSWLNEKGLPQVNLAELWVPVSSPNLIESKSLKLYLNSFNQSKFNHAEQVRQTLQDDLSACAGGQLEVKLFTLDSRPQGIGDFAGVCLDELDIEIESYHRNADLLEINAGPLVHEKLYSHLLKSNCPVTGQPDWASVYIEYSGRPIKHASLLKYIVSYREHSGFHEQCVEYIFLDIMQRCQPGELTVYARYLRRGGLDINPYRSTKDDRPENLRLLRQ